MSSVSFRAVSKAYGHTKVLSQFDLDIRRGEFMVLVGPSGCGKSTLLRLVAGLEQPTEGFIEIDGQNVSHVGPKERGVAMVFQNYALYPHMTVRSNLAFSLKLSKIPSHQIEERVSSAASLLGITEHLDKKPGQLSGGQKQRVAIGRAIVRDPRVFLFDEPLSNLDAQLRIKMRSEISLLHRRLQSTVIYVTHDQVEAMTLADRIAVLNHGKLEQVGPPLEVYRSPETKFVASFIGTPAMNFLPTTFLPFTGPRGVTEVGFRSDAILLGPSSNSGALHLGDAKVTLIEPLGPQALLYLQLNDHTLVAESPIAQIPVLNAMIPVSVDRTKIFYFDSSGTRIGEP